MGVVAGGLLGIQGFDEDDAVAVVAIVLRARSQFYGRGSYGVSGSLYGFGVKSDRSWMVTIR